MLYEVSIEVPDDEYYTSHDLLKSNKFMDMDLILIFELKFLRSLLYELRDEFSTVTIPNFNKILKYGDISDLSISYLNNNDLITNSELLEVWNDYKITANKEDYLGIIQDLARNSNDFTSFLYELSFDLYFTELVGYRTCPIRNFSNPSLSQNHELFKFKMKLFDNYRGYSDNFYKLIYEKVEEIPEYYLINAIRKKIQLMPGKDKFCLSILDKFFPKLIDQIKNTGHLPRILNVRSRRDSL